MKKIFINIQAKLDKFDKNYEIAFLDIKEKHNLEIINFYIKGDIINSDIFELKNIGINMVEYFNEEDLLLKIKIEKIEKNNLKLDNVNYYINTYVENLIPVTNEIRSLFGQKICDFPELFRNKRLQRELLLKSDKGVGSKFKKINI
ncbi:MAG: hypothetical protein Q9M97_01790 [Candidatus Gracilibacteria bacterium]|nr:hypothetical protein [Candidatus Gracilibacteria bacterium]